MAQPPQARRRPHRAPPPTPAPFYGPELTDSELDALAIATQLQGLDAEIALMRLLARRAVIAGDLDQARKALNAIANLLILQKKLAPPVQNTIELTLGRVLETLAVELESRNGNGQ